MLTKEPELRPTATECLNHEWFTEEPIFKLASTASFIPEEAEMKPKTSLIRISQILHARKTQKQQGALHYTKVESLIEELLKNRLEIDKELVLRKQSFNLMEQLEGLKPDDMFESDLTPVRCS